jgi:hypothetical protein
MKKFFKAKIQAILKERSSALKREHATLQKN